jgi:hypothetical protein
MKLSKLRELCGKAIDKYGDMEVGSYDKDYAYNVESPEEMHSIKLRILSTSGSLPGESLDREEDEASSAPVSRFACIFYED